MLSFHYLVVGLPDLEAKSYEATDNPLAAALSAWMRSSEQRRVIRWLKILRRVAQLRLNPAQQALAASVVELSLPLSASEQEELRELTGIEPEVIEMTTVFERWGLEKGRAEGMQQGMQQGRVEGVQEGLKSAVLRLATRKFGNLPEPIQQRIVALQDEAELNAVLDRLLLATSPEGLFTQ